VFPHSIPRPEVSENTVRNQGKINKEEEACIGMKKEAQSGMPVIPALGDGSRRI
jgi:hypothetical protein